MKKRFSLSLPGMASGWLYFYIHFVTEVICFYCLSRVVGDSAFLWVFPLIYDALAFVPQSLIGYLSDKFPKINFGIIGVLMMAFAGLDFGFGILPGRYTALVILCLGNAAVHISGAENTLRISRGKLSHSAVFVSGGSFGVISGRLLAKTFVPHWAVSLLVLTAVPFIILADMYRKESLKENRNSACTGFNYASDKLPAMLVLLLAVTVVAVRGYMGYGIPTSWNKTIVQNVLLYCAMGIGKASGGILADIFGVKRIAMLSATLALPFLLFGDKVMGVSLIGVMLFSMTMSITLALIVSVLPDTPGLAFGFTTIGLFIGTAPIFFFRFTTVLSNCVVIAVLTVLCLVAMQIIIRKDEKKNA